mgnify:CR=1 FL=1
MGRMWTLVLDTATPYLSLGLFRGEAGVGRVKRVERRHEEVLFGLLEEVLREVGAGREEIGALVMDELKRLDKVAYVRFASVYRHFRDISEFMSELKDLLNAKE